MSKRTAVLGGLVPVGISIVLGEAVLRIVLPAPTAYRALPPHLKAVYDVHFAGGVAGPSRYEVNSMGVRGREWGPDRRAECRILCLGGSTTESLINDQSRVWTWRLEQELSRLPDGRQAWVGNAGRSGWSSRHHVQQARHLLDVYDPDWVVVFCGVNDLSSRLWQGESYSPHFTEDPANEPLLVRQSFAVAPGRFPGEWPADPWFKRTRLWLMFRALKYRTRNPPEEAQDPEGRYLVRWRQARAGGHRTAELPSLDAALDEYGRNLREIVRLARAHGAGMTLMTQPVLWRADLTDEEKALLWMGGVGDFRNHPGSLYYEPAALARGMAAYNERMLDVCRETGAHCLDLAAVVPSTVEYFWDDCHLTDRAQSLIGETLASALREPLSRRAAAAGASAVAAR